MSNDDALSEDPLYGDYWQEQDRVWPTESTLNDWNIHNAHSSTDALHSGEHAHAGAWFNDENCHERTNEHDPFTLNVMRLVAIHRLTGVLVVRHYPIEWPYTAETRKATLEQVFNNGSWVGVTITTHRYAEIPF